MTFARLNFKKWAALVLSSALLSACGGSSGSGDGDDSGADASQEKQGYFLDSAVAGLRYESNSYEGFTGENGEFTFKPGESTSFSFHGIAFGSVIPEASNPVITPLTVLNTSDVDAVAVANMLVLLQTFDNDQDPSNGISIPSGGALDGMSEFTLDINDATFQVSLLQAAEDAGFGNGITLVDEDEAKAHFNETLLTLAAISDVVGTWAMRSGEGDVSATYDFNANGTLTITEYDNCQSNDVYWAATTASAANNCTVATDELQWQQTDRLISMSNDTIDDTCTALTMSKSQLTANCLFFGSGLGYETITFERQLDVFDTDFMEVNFAELSVGTTNYTNQTFNDDAESTGSYQYIEDGVAQTAAGDMGDFTWSIIGDGESLSITGTDNGDEAFDMSFNFEGYYNGSWQVSFTDPDDMLEKSAILKANFNIADAEDFATMTSNIAIYDADTGACKGNVQLTYQLESGVAFSSYANNHENDIICGELSGTDEATSTGVLTVDGGAAIIDKSTPENIQEICWPISETRFSDKPVYTMACSTEVDGSGEFEMEIWRVRS